MNMAAKRSELNVYIPPRGDKNAIKAIDHYLMTDEEKLQAGSGDGRIGRSC